MASRLCIYPFNHFLFRESQYNHKRMLEGGELNVSNPVYMRKDPDDEDDDEMEPLGARDIYTGNSVRNSGLMHSLR